MTITELIQRLEKIKAEQGDVEVGIYMYAGGEDALCYVTPEFNHDQGLVLLETRYAR